MNTPAMIIDFEATDVSKEAEATQLGYRNVHFDEDGELTAEVIHNRDNQQSYSSFCKPDRAISYGAMAVSHITSSDIAYMPSHKVLVPQYLPVGEAYIIGHNADYDIQVAANAGVDVSQYKAICTQALARSIWTEPDSYSLGALMYYIYPNRAKQYCHNAHDAGWDVTFTLWLLEHICDQKKITSMEQLYLASEEARIPKTFTFGKYKDKTLYEVRAINPGYLHYVIDNFKDKPYLVAECKRVLSDREVKRG